MDSFGIIIGLDGPKADSFNLLDNDIISVNVTNTFPFLPRYDIQFSKCTPELTQNYVNRTQFDLLKLKNSICLSNEDKMKLDINNNAISFNLACDQDSKDENEQQRCKDGIEFLKHNQIKIYGQETHIDPNMYVTVNDDQADPSTFFASQRQEIEGENSGNSFPLHGEYDLLF